MELNEQALAEALGVQLSADIANAGAAETPGENIGENVQEVAEPVEVESNSSPEDDNLQPVGAEDGVKTPASAEAPSLPKEGWEETPAAMTPEQRRENAARRREAEKRAAIEAAVKEAREAERAKSQQDWEAFFKSANLTNTLTDEPITTKAEFDKWRADYEAAELGRELRDGKLTPEALDRAISENPVVKQAREIIERTEAEQRRQEQQTVEARIAADIAEIGRFDPGIKSVADLKNMLNYEAFERYVREHNMTFLDAYRLANFDLLNKGTAQAARQQAISNARSKSHLTATTARGGGAISVPADEMAAFKLFNPDASEADIQAYYAKYKQDN